LTRKLTDAPHRPPDTSATEAKPRTLAQQVPDVSEALKPAEEEPSPDGIRRAIREEISRYARDMQVWASKPAEEDAPLPTIADMRNAIDSNLQEFIQASLRYPIASGEPVTLDMQISRDDYENGGAAEFRLRAADVSYRDAEQRRIDQAIYTTLYMDTDMRGADSTSVMGQFSIGDHLKDVRDELKRHGAVSHEEGQLICWPCLRPGCQQGPMVLVSREDYLNLVRMFGRG
jgi:hypothetical protein